MELGTKKASGFNFARHLITWATVDPEPRPTAMPRLTNLAAVSAAEIFQSSTPKQAPKKFLRQVIKLLRYRERLKSFVKIITWLNS
jgi:hypothetical protein